jgi:hypothetical protein
MAEQKTNPTIADPARFIAAIDDPQKRADAAALIRLLAEVTGQAPVMWGPSIVVSASITTATRATRSFSASHRASRT